MMKMDKKNFLEVLKLTEVDTLVLSLGDTSNGFVFIDFNEFEIPR